MGRKAENLLDRRFGKLTVIRRADNNKENKAMWLCRCDCGNEKVIAAAVLKRGDTISCGCMKGIRGDLPIKPDYLRRSHTNKLYNVWASMRNRCYTPSTSSYPHYGGRGIGVCEEWNRSFECFAEWAVQSGYAEGMEIDRIDNSGDYCQSNCRWIDHKTNSRNRRGRNGHGCPGVTFRKSRSGEGGSWRVSITADGKIHRVGTFHCEAEAIAARKQAERIHWGGDADP